MTLSAALLSGRIKFEVEAARYLPFQGCVIKGFPDALPETFPLAFACPFTGGDSTEASRIMRELIPAEAMPTKTAGIFFLCDAIDCLAAMHHWTERQVGELVERIEAAFAASGLDHFGRCAA